MKEQIHNWLTDKMKVGGVLACAIRSPDRKTFTRSVSPQFAPVALENACRCLSDAFQIINSNRFPTDLIRWVYENHFVYGFIRQDGHCFTILTRRNAASTLQPADLQQIVSEFHGLEV
jgi:hypothetical protein